MVVIRARVEPDERMLRITGRLDAAARLETSLAVVGADSAAEVVHR